MRLIAFDTETYPIGMFPTTGTPKVTVNPVPRMVCMTSHDGHRTELTRGAKAVEQFVYWLRQPNIHLIAHNTTFDVLVMIRAAQEFGYKDILPEVFQAYEDGRMHDTYIRQQLIDIATKGLEKAYKLSTLVKRHFNVDISGDKSGDDAWRMRYNELDPWPTELWPDEAQRYAKDDAIWAYKVYLEQMRDTYSCVGTLCASRAGVQNEQLQTMAMFAFGLMSAWGMRVDHDWASQIEVKYRDMKRVLDQHMQGFGLMRPDNEGATVNKAEVERVFAAAFASFGEPPRRTKASKTYPEGQIATNKFAYNALEDLYALDTTRDMDPRFKVLRLHNKLKTFLSTYIEPMLFAHPYPVCTRYGLVASGRSSSSRPNLQNLPKRDIEDDPFKASDIRRAFIPRDGNVFIDADYATLELRTLAQVTLNLGYRSAMADALNRGRDLHTDFAAQILGMDYTECLNILEHHDHPLYKKVKKQRAIAKIANFGLPGGLGARGFVQYARGFGTKIDPLQAAELRDAWRIRWPEMEFYFEWIKSLKLPTENYGVPQHGPMGSLHDWRVRCCTKHDDKSPYNAACNTPFQGMAADGCKLSFWKIVKACYVQRESPLFGFRPSVFVHDQFMLEGPEHRASGAAHELQRLMRDGMALMVKDIPVESSVAIGRRWDVDMESPLNEHGEFQIYEGRAAS